MASLVITKQTALAKEKFAKNGVQKEVHVIVKNAAFTVICQLLDISGNPMSLAGYYVEAALLYDCEEGKEVDFVKMKPMEYKSQCNEKEDQYQFEIRLKVLSSQLEDMFFRIRFSLVEASSKTRIPGLCTTSEPIKVISKPDQIKKKSNKSKKRAAPQSDMNMADALSRIELQQIEQQKLLKKLVKQSQKIDAVTTTVTTQLLPPSPPLSTSAPTLHIEPVAEVSLLNSFETAFSALLSYYQTLSPEERPIKIRKLIRSTPSKEINNLSEMLDLFSAEGMQKEFRPQGCGGIHSSQVTECSVQDCPHKKELERIDDFYRDFLSSSLDYSPF